MNEQQKKIIFTAVYCLSTHMPYFEQSQWNYEMKDNQKGVFSPKNGGKLICFEYKNGIVSLRWSDRNHFFIHADVESICKVYEDERDAFFL